MGQVRVRWPPLDTTQRALALVQTLSGDAQTHVRNPRSTVAPPRHDRLQGARILALLRTLSRPPPALEEEGTLGRGGMGVVQLATQVTLGRKVAVKRLVAGNVASEDIEALLSEAWLAGSLEHPNIVPVHDLGLVALEPAVDERHVGGSRDRAHASWRRDAASCLFTGPLVEGREAAPTRAGPCPPPVGAPGVGRSRARPRRERPRAARPSRSRPMRGNTPGGCPGRLLARACPRVRPGLRR